MASLGSRTSIKRLNAVLKGDRPARSSIDAAFAWSETNQRSGFWSRENSALLPSKTAISILRKERSRLKRMAGNLDERVVTVRVSSVTAEGTKRVLKLPFNTGRQRLPNKKTPRLRGRTEVS